MAREAVLLWQATDRIKADERRMQMKWDLMIAQLAQPVSSKEGAREYQRLMSDLWRHTEDREQEELVSDRGKDSFESLMGFSFVRGSGVGVGEASDEDEGRSQSLGE